MTVTLNPEQERVVGQAIDAGLIAAADEVVNAGVEAIRQRLESRTRESRQQAIDAAATRLRTFAQRYHFTLGGLSIKELINEGRR